MTIYKYPIRATDVQSVEMPEGAEILTVQTQNGDACIWALVNEDAPYKVRRIEVFGTGHQVSEEHKRKYIGTFQLRGGALVFHVFERLERA